ncbi:hypothetical protein [Ectorhizobium quercum]|uniref:hypothetical protein n=1 Tax=Ectorhizobium quercum TaxID=2965071 RepID=UPI002795D9AF|nr:hypothetical protein [Ectorhizobium quercum]
MFYAIAAVLLLTTYVTGLTALAIYLADIAGAPIALLSIAIGALAIALVIIAVAISTSRRERELRLLREQIAQEQALRPGNLANSLMGIVPVLTRGNPFASVLVAGLTAFAAGFAATSKRKKN